MIRENNDEAVSDTVGFILILGIVVVSMGLIYSLGYPLLMNNMDSSIFESTEQSFIMIQSNMKMVSYDQVPVKNLKLKMYSSTFASSNRSTVTIEYNDGSPNTLTYPTGEIEYRKDDNVITYENGCVWKRYPSGGVLVSGPNIYTSTLNGKDMTTIGVVSLQGDSSGGGSSIINLNMQHNSSEMIRPGSPVNVTLHINNTYAPVWGEYLEGAGFAVTGFTDSSVTAQRNNTWLVVGHHVVDVEIS